MKQLTAFSLAAIVVHFVDTGNKLISYATKLREGKFSTRNDFAELLFHIRGLHGIAIYQLIPEGLSHVLATSSIPQDAEKRQAKLIYEQLKSVQAKIEDVTERPLHPSRSWSLEKDLRHLHQIQTDEQLRSVAAAVSSQWNTDSLVASVATVSQHRGSLDAIILQLLDNAETVSTSAHHESEHENEHQREHEKKVTQVLAVNLHKDLKTIAALVTKNNSELTSLAVNEKPDVTAEEESIGDVIRYTTVDDSNNTPVSHDVVSKAESPPGRRNYGATVLSGSGPAHLGDTLFTAPINIQQVVLVDEKHRFRSASDTTRPSDQYQPNVSRNQATTSSNHVHGLPSQQLKHIVIDDSNSVVGKIRAALDFREESFRIFEVKEAHRRTFSWIFIPSASEDGHHFPSWLATEQRCFWINGKAGSGKSTLMKYILQNPQTVTCLEAWAGKRRLIVAPHFFWHLGTTLQKSYEGVLRSLLLQVLKRDANLASVLFPRSYLQLLGSEKDYRHTLAMQDLQQAIDILTKNLPDDLALFIMIDGVDEYSGDYYEFCKFLVRLTNNPAIKILVSGRPIPACHHVFSRFQTLRVQDLTTCDVEYYIEDELMNDELLQDVDALRPGFAHQIKQELSDKASGVFLWIILVVRNILIGLGNYDDPDALLQQIDSLPSDLEELYNHMFAKMSPQYQEEGSMLLQLTKRALEVQSSSFTAIQASYADYASPNSFSKGSLSNTDEVIKMRIKMVDGRIRSRCCGLLEVQYKQGRSLTEPKVNFLHRTVVEYLKSYNIWEKLQILKNCSKSDIDIILLQSCSQVMHLYQSKKDSTEFISRQAELLRDCFKYSHMISDAGADGYADYLYVADTIFAYSTVDFWFQNGRFDYYNRHYNHSLQEGNKKVPTVYFSQPGEMDYVRLFFVSSGLSIFWRRKLKDVSQENRAKLLARILALLSLNENLFTSNDFANLDVLLELTNPNVSISDKHFSHYSNPSSHGAKGHSKPLSTTPWLFWLETIHKGVATRNLWMITLKLIRSGADLKAIAKFCPDLLKMAEETRQTLRKRHAQDDCYLLVLDELMSSIKSYCPPDPGTVYQTASTLASTSLQSSPQNGGLSLNNQNTLLHAGFIFAARQNRSLDWNTLGRNRLFLFTGRERLDDDEKEDEDEDENGANNDDESRHEDCD